VTDDGFTAEERRWLRTWGEKTEQVAAGDLTAAEVCEWVWRDKVLNAINVTIQRIKRSEQPGMDPRRRDNTWVTLAAERGTRKEDISVLALQALTFVFQRLKSRGHDFDVDWMPTAHGVVVLSVNIRELREFMERRAADRKPD
jgi:hypothetical protein